MLTFKMFLITDIPSLYGCKFAKTFEYCMRHCMSLIVFIVLMMI